MRRHSDSLPGRQPAVSPRRSFAPVPGRWVRGMRRAALVAMSVAMSGRISQQMDQAGRTVAVCSPAYFDSHWCTQEWTGALAGRAVTPARVADVKLPPVLSTIGCRDLHGVDEAGARRRLLEALGLTAPAGRRHLVRAAGSGEEPRRPARGTADPF